MKVFRPQSFPCSLVMPAVVCLGVFDGVHLGHQQLIKEALQIAEAEKLVPVVHTYEPLPVSVVDPESQVFELSPAQERIALLERYGILHVAVSRFDKDMQQMSGKDFFNKVLLDQLHARHIVAGYNHRFGYLAKTDIGQLKLFCEAAEVGFTAIQPVKTPQGQLVSSSAIRSALARGDFQLASDMLGREIDPSIKQRLSAQGEGHEHTTEV